MISSFKNFLVEEEKTVYFVWGRMNPPTAGHEKLLDFAKQKAGKNPLRIYLTQSFDKKRNPLDYKTKVKFARKGFPKYARQIMLDTNVKLMLEALVSFYNEGFKKLVIVAGGDRVREYEVLANKYNGQKSRHGFYKFENITVLNAGNRDPDSKGVEGVSGTKLRGFAEAGDFAGFAQFMPRALTNAETKEVFNAVRKGLGLETVKEYRTHVQLKQVSEIRESYVNGELFKEGDTVVVKDTGELARVKRLGSNYVIIEGSGNTYRKWLDAIEPIETKGEYSVANFSVQKESLSENNIYDVADFSMVRYDDPAITLEDLNRQDADIKDRKGSQPAAYHKGLAKSTKVKRDAHFKKHGKKADNDPSAYQPAPGDKGAKTKPSKYTKAFKDMYGEQTVDAVRDRISREREVERRRDAADKKRHDSMMDRARAARTRQINRRTKSVD